MYGSPADARGQPSPQPTGHGNGRPPDGQPGVVRAIAHSAWSLLGWSKDHSEALPPLAPSGGNSDDDGGPSVDAQPRQPTIPRLVQSNAHPTTSLCVEKQGEKNKEKLNLKRVFQPLASRLVDTSVQL